MVTPGYCKMSGPQDLLELGELCSDEEVNRHMHRHEHRRVNRNAITRNVMLKAKEISLPAAKFAKHMKYLIRKGLFDPKVVDANGYNILMVAVIAKNVDAIRTLFLLGIWSQVRDYRIVAVEDITDDSGKDALELAQTKVRSKKILREIQKCDELEACLTEMLMAARAGNVDKVKDLITLSSLTLRNKDSEGNGALHYACMNGHVEVVKALVKEGADIQDLNGSGQNALHLTSKHNNMSVLHYLLGLRNIDLSEEDNEMKTPLHYTAVHGNFKALRAILRLKYNAELEEEILGTAANRGNAVYTRLIIDQLGLDLMLIDKHNKSVLHHACGRSRLNIIDYVVTTLCENQLVQLLLQKDRSSRNIFHTICDSEHGTSSVLKRMVQLAKRLDILNKMIDVQDVYTGVSSCVLVCGRDKGRKAYHFVETKRHNASKFEKEVRSGMVHDIAHFGRTVKSDWGEPTIDDHRQVKNILFEELESSENPALDSTPLHLALYKEKRDHAKLLLDVGADVNVQDSFGNTAIHLAAMRGNLELVKMIEEAGADLTISEYNGLTAAQVARENEHFDVVFYLEAKEHMDRAEVFFKTVTQKIELLSRDNLEKKRQECSDVRQYLVGTLRELHIDVNIALMAIGSSPIMEET